MKLKSVSIFFFSLCLLACLKTTAQDTLIWKNGNTMLVHIISSDSIVRYQDFQEPYGEVFSLKHADLASIHYSNGRKEKGDWSLAEIKKSKYIQAKVIHPAFLIYRQGGVLLGEPEMLSRVGIETKDPKILDEIEEVRNARRTQATVMLTGLGMFGTGVFIAWRSEARYLNPGVLIGVGIAFISIPVEAGFLIPYTIRKVRAYRVMNRYNASLLN
ncbi:MAG TPA: hypothetical protein VNZ86_07155 [Bacteroidia bacterium]|nr:hypothetical protein [Bacteroidia bacterium]